MTIKSVNELLSHAEKEKYAIGYFECWNLESLMAVADAAEATQSPVLLGFSGIYLPHHQRARREHLEVYSALGTEICHEITVPSALVFNESPHVDWIVKAIQCSFHLVMFSDEQRLFSDQVNQVKRITDLAHQKGVAVEGEVAPLPGVGGNLVASDQDQHLTDVATAGEFIKATGIDAIAVNVGQMHFHGRRAVQLDQDLIISLNSALDVPLVLHGATSISPDDLSAAVKNGVRKINVGSALKQVYFEQLREMCQAVGENYNPYQVIGSGLSEDVLMAGRIALQQEVEKYMHLFGSSGKASSFA